MPKVSNEGTPRERLARLLALLGRTRRHLRSASAVALVVLGVAVIVALRTKGVWRSEATILYRDAVQIRDGEPASRRAARLGPKLKELVHAQSWLAGLVAEMGLYPQKAGDSAVDAVLEMQKHIGFRASSSDTFVVSFAHDDPVVAQRVTARLAELVIDDYERESVDTASLTRDLLRKELGEADRRVEEASRALATFLAKHPQFTWGTESPYATMPVPGLPFVAVPAAPAAPGAAPRPVASDPETAALELRLARIEAELAPPGAAPAPAAAASPELAEAEKRKVAADAALRVAEVALADKLREVTPAHPDAVAARGAVAAARAAAASATAAVAAARGGAPVAAVGGGEELSPERRAELAKERAALRQRLAERRARGPAAADAPRPDGAPARPGTPPSDVVELETEWHRLRLELDQARERARAAQVDARTLAGSADDVRKKSQAEMLLLDPAYLPPRPERGRGRVLFAGAFVALFLSLGYAASRVLLDDTLYDESDVEAVGGPEVLVALPPLDVREPEPRPVVPVAWWAEPLDPDAAPLTVVDEDPIDFDDDPVPSGVHVRPIPVGPATERDGASTLRFGSFADDALDSARPIGGGPPRPRVDFADRPPPRAPAAPLAVARPPLLRAAPDVEVVAADVDADGAGAGELLGRATPAALATLRVLRHRLDLRRGDGHLVVTVTSPGLGEGKTTLAARLALALSEADRASVALVEGHLAAPRLAATLGVRLPDEAGLSEQIRRHATGRRGPWGVVRLTPSLALLAEPTLEAAFPGALHSPHLGLALRALRDRYDYVVVDGPPVLGAGDANVLEELSDGVLVVVRAGATQATALARATHQLGERRILGVVLNGAPPSSA